MRSVRPITCESFCCSAHAEFHSHAIRADERGFRAESPVCGLRYTMKVLIADDDADVLDITAYALRREGFHVSIAADGKQALNLWKRDDPDVVLLDVRMPKMSGFEVLRTIRSEAETPVIFVTARKEDEDIVRGLELGADDYVTKPFSTRQLIARIRSVTRRMSLPLPSTATEIEAGGMVLNVESHQVTRGGQNIHVTPLEYRLLHALMLNVGRVISSDRLSEQTWGPEGGNANMLKTHICHIRKKLGLIDGEPGYIKSIVAVGYVMER
jgi:DNA-binding response OmpR family regulator